MSTTVKIGNNTGDDYVGIEDTIMDEANPTLAHGTYPRIYVGNTTLRKFRSLHRWNLSDIPAGSVCVSAVLSLYDTDWGDRGQDTTITLYKISDANGNWIEGTGYNSPAVGEPCYSYKAYDPSTPTSWAGSAGLLTAGTDYINTSLGSAVFTDGVSGYKTITLNADGRAVLESWFGTTGGNGILLVGSGTFDNPTELFASEGDDGKRPYLTIEYTTPLMINVSDNITGSEALD